MADEKTEKDGIPKRTVSRDKVTLGLMGVAAFSAIAGFAVLFSKWWSIGPPNAVETLKIATRESIAGNVVIAGNLAKTVKFEDEESETIQEETRDWIKLRDYLVVVSELDQISEIGDLKLRRGQMFDGLKRLETIGKQGFPAGREIEGKRILAESYLQLGRFKEANSLLAEVIERDPTLRRSLLLRLAESSLQASEPAYEATLATIDEFLTDTTLRPAQIREGTLIRVAVLTKMGRFGQAEEAIAKEEARFASAGVATQSEAIDYRDRLRLAAVVVDIEQAIGRYGKSPRTDTDDRSQVAEELSGAMDRIHDLNREAAPRTAAKAKIWGGRAFLCQGDKDKALALLTSARQMRPFLAESIVAGLEEIEILASEGRGEEVLQTVRYMLREIGDERSFDASMLSIDEFRSRLVVSLEHLRRKEQYESAIDIARSLPPLFQPSQSLMQEGISYREWAQHTLEKGTSPSGDVPESVSQLSRGRFRAAGDAFAKSSELEFDTVRFLPTQWAAIDAYQQGRHFQKSVGLLRLYLRYEERRRQPRGFVAFGRALLAGGKSDEAINALETVLVEFPRDPLRYDARLLLAMAHSEKGDIDKSRVNLTDNLLDGELTPESPAWRDSLFTLAETLYRKSYENHLASQHADLQERDKLLRENQPLLAEAIRRLDEAVERYWPHPRAESAAYLAACSHAWASNWPRIESESSDVLDTARRTLRAQAENELQLALEGYTNLKDRLLQRDEELALSENSQTLLRNCFMGEADTLKKMGRLEDAATAYRTISLRYMNQPLALEAILGQARCVRELGRNREADLLIRQAKVVLEQIPAEFDDQFVKSTRHDRKGWEKLINWMNEDIRDS